MTLTQAILVFFLPGVAVGLKKGFLSKESGIAWLLTLLGHIPGVIYGLVELGTD